MKRTVDDKGFTLEEFLQNYKAKDYPKPSVTADIVLFSIKEMHVGYCTVFTVLFSKAFISYTHFVLLSFIIIPPDEALRSTEYHTVHSKLQPQQGR